MDLISKKAAVSRISDLLVLELKGKRIPTWNEVYNAIGDIPSVPAVPLEPLCEWLAVNASYIFGGYNNTWKFEARHWEHVIREWMKDEGLDATDRCRTL